MSYDPFRMPPVTAVHKYSYCHQEQKHFQPSYSFQTPEHPVQPNGQFLTLLCLQSESQAKELMGLRTNMGPERIGGTLVEDAWFGWWNSSPENQVNSLGINSATQWYKGIYLTPHWKFPTAQNIITFTAQRLEDRRNEPLGWDRHGLWWQCPQHPPAMLMMACSPEEHCRFTLEHGTVSGIPLQNKTVLAKTQWQKPKQPKAPKSALIHLIEL